jgi:hypothetical protein
MFLERAGYGLVWTRSEHGEQFTKCFLDCCVPFGKLLEKISRPNAIKLLNMLNRMMSGGGLNLKDEFKAPPPLEE